MSYYLKYLKYKNKYSQLKNQLGGNWIDNNYPPSFTFGSKNIKAMILPHAGSRFVKPIMDYIFDQIDNNLFDNIIIISTNHKDKNNYIFDSYDKVNISEHSFLSVKPYITRISELTNLSKLTNNIKIFVIGSYSDDYCNQNILTNIIDTTLIIANTDLLHCGENYNNTCPTDILDHNRQIINNIINNNIGDNSDMCGHNAIKTFLYVINKLKYSFSEYVYNSSDKIIDDTNNSVGYLGMIYNDKNNLDNTIRNNLQHNKILSSLPELFTRYLFDNNLTDNLSNSITRFRKDKLNNNYLIINDIDGIFITINNNNKLRGCIGTFRLKGDVIDTILHQTYLSLFSDHRFDPVNNQELQDLTYSITYLKKPFEINKDKLYDTFIVGLHGITLYFESTSATYLASVMIEHFQLNKGDRLKESDYNRIKQSLQDKSGSSTDIINKIEIYECIDNN